MTNSTVKERNFLTQETNAITVLQNYGSSAPTALFQGYDSVSGRGLSSAVSGPVTTSSASSSVQLSICPDVATLTKALNINQSASAAFGAIASSAPKMQFLQHLNLTPYCTSLVLYASRGIEVETSTSPVLTNSIGPANTNEGLNAFFQAYGDSYVSSITRGGEYYAVYTFYTQTLEEQTTFVSTLRTKGIQSGMNIDAALQTKLSNFIAYTTQRWNFKQNIAGLLHSQLPEPNNIVAFALSFPRMTLSLPEIIQFQTSGYENIPKISNFSSIQANRNYFVGHSAVDGLAKRLVQIRQQLNQIHWLQETYHCYGGFHDSKLEQVKEQANADLAKINHQIQQYEFDPTQNFTMPALSSLTAGAPALRYQTGVSPAFGGNEGGNAFNDVPTIGQSIAQHRRVTSVQLRGSQAVDGLNIGYQNDNDNVQYAHGGSSGTLGPLLTLLPGQFISGISGRQIGQQIKQLQIQISDGRGVTGGSQETNNYTWTVPKGCFVVGFSGRSSPQQLNQIQVNYAGFEPAQWQ